MARVVTSPQRRDNVSPRPPVNHAVNNQRKSQNACPPTQRHVLNAITSPGQYTDVATEDIEIVTALKLVARSVAEQRQVVGKHLIYHPIVLVFVAILLAFTIKLIYHDPSNWLFILVTGALVPSIALHYVLDLVSGYVHEAERVGTLNWLYGHDPGRETDASSPGADPPFNTDNGITIVLIHRLKRRIIGTLVMSVVCRDAGLNSDTIMLSIPTGEPYKAFIRAWTVRQQFRGYGIGTALLDEAVRICDEKKWQAPRFATRHANSLRLLHPMFHRDMDRASAMWNSYLRTRVEAHRQYREEWEAREKWEAREVEASRNMMTTLDRTMDMRVHMTRLKVKLDVSLRQYLNSSLEKAVDAQSRWKDML
ncbi:Acyl-CoA N-acyltransferase [Penicillium paradoxum]|uniref:Acyl-CoA N-acyltransferase n=1 Tax=Penicillium paradoxum TaxID=176176 RepID=UPI0025491FCE|nr:Acyl-CoA N-acyltransferase [Penicillium paradoxum]KAJ5773662.1 Acyl-CoA N-acyltransferase [Penicillium paradoxum]